MIIHKYVSISKRITHSRIKFKYLLFLFLLPVMFFVFDVVHSEFEERIISGETATEFIVDLEDNNFEYRTIENGSITSIFYIENNYIMIKVFETNDIGKTITYYSIETLLAEEFSENLIGYEDVYRYIYDVKSASYFNSDTLKHVYIFCIDCVSDSVSTINGFEKVEFSNGSTILIALRHQSG